MPTSQPILMRALRWGVLSTLLLIVLFAGIGWLVSGWPGLTGGVIGTVIGGIFLLMTAGSIAFANRFIASPSFVVLFFIIVLGTWVLKFIIFLVAAVLLRDQVWLDPTVLFFGIVAAVLLSLVIDVLVIARSRLPYVSDAR